MADHNGMAAGGGQGQQGQPAQSGMQMMPAGGYAAPPGTYAPPQFLPQQLQQQNEQLRLFWIQQMQEIQQVGTDPAEFKNHQLPLARIKKIMKSDEDVRMISAEAPVLFARACEMFILELTHRSWNHSEENKRRTLQRNDIAAAITRTDIFDFLGAGGLQLPGPALGAGKGKGPRAATGAQVDIVPREERGEEAGGARPAAMPSAPLPAVTPGYWPQQGLPLAPHHSGHGQPDHMLAAGHAAQPQGMHMDPAMMQYYLQHQQQQQHQPQPWQTGPPSGAPHHPALQAAYEGGDGSAASQQA